MPYKTNFEHRSDVRIPRTTEEKLKRQFDVIVFKSWSKHDVFGQIDIILTFCFSRNLGIVFLFFFNLIITRDQIDPERIFHAVINSDFIFFVETLFTNKSLRSFCKIIEFKINMLFEALCIKLFFSQSTVLKSKTKFLRKNMKN